MADEHTMSEAQWEKASVLPAQQKTAKRSGRWRFMVLGAALLGAALSLTLAVVWLERRRGGAT